MQLHSGETVKRDAEDPDAIVGVDPVLFEMENEAWAYALARFGETAGREYAVVDVQDIS